MLDVRLALLLLYTPDCFLHVHAEAERAALVDAIRMHSNLAATRLHNLLDHGQTESDAHAVDFCRALQLPEASEQLWEILSCDTRALVYHVDYQGVVDVACYHCDGSATYSELKRVLDQIDQHLLEASFIA